MNDIRAFMAIQFCDDYGNHLNELTDVNCYVCGKLEKCLFAPDLISTLSAMTTNFVCFTDMFSQNEELSNTQSIILKGVETNSRIVRDCSKFLATEMPWSEDDEGTTIFYRCL